MAYDVELSDRVRTAVAHEPGLTEKRMFGGLAFFIHGRLAVSASSQGGLLVRVDPARTQALVDEPLVTRFRMRGREMDGWLHVDGRALQREEDLRRWVRHGVTYARSLHSGDVTDAGDQRPASP